MNLEWPDNVRFAMENTAQDGITRTYTFPVGDGVEITLRKLGVPPQAPPDTTFLRPDRWRDNVAGDMVKGQGVNTALVVALDDLHRVGSDLLFNDRLLVHVLNAEALIRAVIEALREKEAKP